MSLHKPAGVCRGCGGNCQPGTYHCRACIDAFRKAKRAARALEAAQQHAQAQEHLSRYRCRAHLDEAVTWKGAGCAPCSADRRALLDRRRRERAAARAKANGEPSPGDDPTTERTAA